eukprot:scaffold126512_cov28-Attheya_sp.AAC.1
MEHMFNCQGHRRGAWAIEVTSEHATGQHRLLHSRTGSAIVGAIVGEQWPSIFFGCVTDVCRRIYVPHSFELSKSSTRKQKMRSGHRITRDSLQS